MKPRVAIVVQRWAPAIAGGSEALAWQYAGLLAEEFDVHLLTSTALDYVTWNSELPEGVARIEGVSVHRFAPAFPRGDYFFALDRRERADREAGNPERWKAVWTTALQEELIKFQGPWCPGLMEHLETHAEEYDAVLLCTYLYPTSYFAATRIRPHKLLLAPTLHDEPMAYLPVYARYRERIGRFLWLTQAERDLARRLWDVDRGNVIGMAIDAVTAQAELTETPYLLYCGRIDVHKNCRELLEWFALHRAAHPETPLKLVLTGKDALGLHEMPDVEFLGFVSEEKKFALMAGARALVQPSRYESFSIVVLEAMSQGTPIVVNGACEVLAEHVAQSGTGYAYRSRDEFDAAIHALAALTPYERQEQSRRARDYAVKRYSRERVRERLVAEVRAVVGQDE
ncbi:MAG TPA: glycosyltransferase family 4 protein [Rhodanobacteraceae bacterium]|jgi:glycosyltransferase involved in cell wall biosynthesis|nr:glycosyltransferase family 4 protein [Rhodanobacteraceae bacterium]